MGKKRQLLTRSRLEKDVFSSYVALQSARSLPPTPNSLSLRGWFFDDVDPPRRLKGDYYTCSYDVFVWLTRAPYDVFVSLTRHD